MFSGVSQLLHHPLADLMRVRTPIGWLLLFWPTLCALFLASRDAVSWNNLLLFAAATWLARSFGCVVNDWADRNFDGSVERTKGRPLATGRADNAQVLLLLAVLSSAGLFLLFQLTPLAAVLSILAVGLGVLYPFCKRWTNFPQVVLGFAFSSGIAVAFAQVRGWEGVMECLPLFFGGVFWVLAYDTAYAMADAPDDQRIGIGSTALAFGRWSQIMVGVFQLCALAFWIWAGLSAPLSLAQQQAGVKLWLFPWWICLGICALMFAWQHVLVSKSQFLAAFRHNSWVGLALSCGAALSMLYL